MMFVVTMSHTPELCNARKEFGGETKAWIDSMNIRAKDLGITIHGAYSCPTEHTFYFILDARDLKAITAFFAGIMLINNAGHISPVSTVQESAGILIK